jgi:hypothetical protein
MLGLRPTCPEAGRTPRAVATVLAIGVRSPVSEPAKPLASSSGSRRRWADEAEARAEFGAASAELLGARAAVAIAVRGVRGHSDQPAETLASSRNRLFRRLCPLSFVLWPFTTACARARSAKPVGRRRRASDALKQRTPRRLGRRRPLSAAAQHHLQWCLQKWSWMPLRSCRPRVYPAPSDAPAQGYARRAPLHAQTLRR